MEKFCNGQESKSAAVIEVIGEPAIVINGLPNLPPGCTTPIRENASGANPDSDPGLCEWLEGRKVQKMFENHVYYGKVLKYDTNTKWYRVIYEDGDLEDLEWCELDEVLVPLHISIPLITLASERCKFFCESSFSGLKLPKATKTTGRSMEIVGPLVQAPHLIESKVGDKIDKNFINERLYQLTSEQHKEIQPESRNCLQKSRRELSTSRPGVKSKRPRDILKQSLLTARAEKQKRREKLMLQGTALHSQEIQINRKRSKHSRQRE